MAKNLFSSRTLLGRSAGHTEEISRDTYTTTEKRRGGDVVENPGDPVQHLLKAALGWCEVQLAGVLERVGISA